MFLVGSVTELYRSWSVHKSSRKLLIKGEFKSPHRIIQWLGLVSRNSSMVSDRNFGPSCRSDGSSHLSCRTRVSACFRRRINNARVVAGNASHIGRILVAADDSKPILGVDFIKSLSIIDFRESFQASFCLKRGASLDGMCSAARSLHFSMQSLVEAEIKRLLSAGIIYPVENPKVSVPIVPVVKQAGEVRPIRICGDYSQTLNRVIDRDSYQLLRLKDILQKVSGATVYSVLDLADEYLQVSLSPESLDLHLDTRGSLCVSETPIRHLSSTSYFLKGHRSHFGRFTICRSVPGRHHHRSAYTRAARQNTSVCQGSFSLVPFHHQYKESSRKLLRRSAVSRLSSQGR